MHSWSGVGAAVSSCAAASHLVKSPLLLVDQLNNRHHAVLRGKIGFEVKFVPSPMVVGYVVAVCEGEGGTDSSLSGIDMTFRVKNPEALSIFWLKNLLCPASSTTTMLPVSADLPTMPVFKQEQTHKHELETARQARTP